MIAQIQELGHARAKASIDPAAEADASLPLASIAFLDYIAAFDSVDHAFLDESLRHAGASPKSRAILRSIYRKANACVRAKRACAHGSFNDLQHAVVVQYNCSCGGGPSMF